MTKKTFSFWTSQRKELFTPGISRHYTTPNEFENGGFTLKRIRCLSSTLLWRNLKTQPWPIILDLSHKKLRFHDGLVWTAGLTVEIILRFQIPLMYCRWGLGYRLITTQAALYRDRFCPCRVLDPYGLTQGQGKANFYWILSYGSIVFFPFNLNHFSRSLFLSSYLPGQNKLIRR